MLARLDGVGDVRIFGARDYAMRIWLDPDKVGLAQPDGRRGRRGAALAERPGRLRRAEPAAGAATRAPTSSTSRRSAACPTRASSATSSSRPTTDGRVTRRARHRPRRARRRRTTPPTAISTSGRPCRSWSSSGPGSNALATAERLHRDDGGAVEELPARACKYDIIYNPTEFIAESVRRGRRRRSWRRSLLVVIVVIVFLQTWRAAIIPIVAIPVSLIGTFMVMAALGYLAEQPVAVRPGAGHRHRRRRRHRRGGERRAQAARRACRRRRRRTGPWTRSAAR